MKIGDKIEVVVTTLSVNGNGTGQVGGYTVFVPEAKYGGRYSLKVKNIERVGKTIEVVFPEDIKFIKREDGYEDIETWDESTYLKEPHKRMIRQKAEFQVAPDFSNRNASPDMLANIYFAPDTGFVPDVVKIEKKKEEPVEEVTAPKSEEDVVVKSVKKKKGKTDAV